MKKSTIAAVVTSGLLATAPALAQDLSVKITNLTHGSYFTPLLVAAHDNVTDVFEVGTTASANLQAMAEGGDLTGLVSDLISASATYVENPAAGLLAPGANTTAMLNTTGTSNDRLSLVTMVLPSNDGFVGLDSLEIPATAGTYTYYLNAYDAGTGDNTESAATVPGQMGEGFNSAREANDMVLMHGGVVSQSDGLAGSALDESHRFDNPAARIVITRI
jgi:hypothetical protein